jgi:membrane protein DedA with SNARE-associated domain
LGLAETFIPYIKQYGYWAIFFVVFFESIGLPLPGETFIVVASLYAVKGVIDLYALIILCVLATFLANNVSYVIGYQGGHEFLSKYGRFILINQKRLNKAELIVRKYEDIVVIFARFIFGLRQLNGLIMGTIKMPWAHFALLNFLGAVLWVACVVAVSFYFGKSLTSFLFNIR